MKHTLKNMGQYRFEDIDAHVKFGECGLEVGLKVPAMIEGELVPILLADIYLEYDREGHLVLYVWDENDVDGDPTHRTILISDADLALAKALEDIDV